jgi:hypothetical protein
MYVLLLIGGLRLVAYATDAFPPRLLSGAQTLSMPPIPAVAPRAARPVPALAGNASLRLAAAAPGQGFPGWGGQARELDLVERFDADKDGVLNAAERRAARAYLNEEKGAPGRRGFGFRRGGRVSAEPGPRVGPADVATYPDAPLYDAATLRTVFLQFEDADWEEELSDFYHTDVDVPATVVVDGRSYRDVGVHFRGNSSFRSVPLGRKHSLTLTFDFVHDDQRLGDYRTLHLLNANEDPSFLKPVLYGDVARDYIPAPKANFVRVVINGESWGVYPNVQPFNKDFLRDHFGTTAGTRWTAPGSPRGRAGLEYLGDEVAPYKRLFDIKSKDNPKAWADLIHLTRVLNRTPAEGLEAALAPILDVDETLRFLALDNALINNDGYWVRASDYSLYEDADGRFHVIPHDYNETLNLTDGRGWGSGAPRLSVELDPLIGLDDESKPLRSKLLAVPALRTRYLRYVHDIADRWLDWKVLGPIALRYQRLIIADVKADTHKLYGFDEFDAAGPGDESLKHFAEKRRAYLLRYRAPDPAPHQAPK